MKAIVLFSVFLLAISAKSQSLVEALYGGKLKADTGIVLRKGDSLKIRENMAQKIIADSIKKVTIVVEKQNVIAGGMDTTSMININTDTSATLSAATVSAEKTIPKDNNKIWKTFIDSITIAIKSEVITSNKLKKGAYSVLIEYEIKPDGQININSVTSDPQNSFLEGQIKVRLTLDAPQLNPVMGTNGKPRTVVKKQLLSYVK